MNKYMFAAGAAVLTLGLTGVANASGGDSRPCAPFNQYIHPAKAKSVVASLVQAYVSCNNPSGRTDNSNTETGTATCYPAETIAGFDAGGQENVPDGTWVWGPKSSGTLSFKAAKNKITGPPNDPTDTTAADLAITIKMSDIQDQDGPVEGPSGSVNSLARTTLIDRAEDKVMTVFDFPTAFSFQVIGGKANYKITATQIINPLGQPALPACTTIELVSVVIRDPLGNDFAHIGTYLP
jgi:hypothetical protein